MLSKRCRYVPGALLALALLPACADLAPPEDLPTDRAAASDDTVEISRAVTTPDVVLDLAESAAGWSATSGNTISVSTTRQQGAGSLSSVGAGVDRFRRTNLGPVDVRNMHYLTFWYFIDDASKILTDRDAQVEISSATAVDTEEMNWNLHGQRLVSGWNFVSLPLPGKLRSASGVAINLAAIRRFRIYHFVSASVTTRIDDIRFTTRADVAVEPSCASAAASATIQNVGETRSTASYGSSTCNKAYVVEVRAYAPTNTTGTVVAYSGPNTTDAAVCGARFNGLSARSRSPSSIARISPRIAIIASMKRSSSYFDSDSVGSTISVPATGKLIVGA